MFGQECLLCLYAFRLFVLSNKEGVEGGGSLGFVLMCVYFCPVMSWYFLATDGKQEVSPLATHNAY